MSSLSTKPRQRRCKFSGCRDYFTPNRKGLKLEECCSPGCRLSYAHEGGSKTAAQLKKLLWPIFSLHQKLVHSVDGEYCQCYTCEQTLKIGTINCQGGHCLPKSVYKNLYFDERAVRPQCVQCNKNSGGMSYDFCENLKQEIGAESFDDMKRHGKDVVKRDRFWYLEKIECYTAQNKLIKQIKTK